MNTGKTWPKHKHNTKEPSTTTGKTHIYLPLSRLHIITLISHSVFALYASYMAPNYTSFLLLYGYPTYG
jgi:hypothetical protein